MNADLIEKKHDDIDMGWLFLEGSRTRGFSSTPRYGFRGLPTLVTRTTLLVAEYLQKHQGTPVKREALKDVLAKNGINPTGVAIALGELKFAFSEARFEGKKLNARQAEKIFDTRDTDTVILLAYNEETREMIRALESAPLQTPGRNIIPFPDPNGDTAPPAEDTDAKKKPETAPAVPAVRSAFAIAHNLPARLDTGKFVIDFEEGRSLPARINGTAHGISTRQFAAFCDIFNAQGNTVTATDLGEKYFAEGRGGKPAKRPEGTAYAAIFHIRNALARADVKDSETLVSTVTGKGFRWTGPKMPKGPG